MGIRKIIFRGRRLDNKSWIYGSLLVWPDNDCYILYQEVGDRSFEITKMQVDPATVGQYTGMKDKNDKEIYEGDIVDYYYLGDNKLGLVKYHTNVFGFELFDIYGSFDYMSGYETRYYHIVGNIHDNIELFKIQNNHETI